jgi:apolipoprotein N-acyltransferase
MHFKSNLFADCTIHNITAKRESRMLKCALDPGGIMLLAFIILFVIYALTFYWSTQNKGDLAGGLLIVLVPIFAVYYLGWMALLYCLAAAYLGTKAALKKQQRQRTLRTSFYEDGDQQQQ